MNNSNNKNQAREKVCYFCVNGYKDIDYKEPNLLRKFTSSYAKIVPKKKSCL